MGCRELVAPRPEPGTHQQRELAGFVDTEAGDLEFVGEHALDGGDADDLLFLNVALHLATVDIDLDTMVFEQPDKGELPPEGIHWRGTFAPQQDEVILKRAKLPLVKRFARANRIDRTAIDRIITQISLKNLVDVCAAAQ